MNDEREYKNREEDGPLKGLPGTEPYRAPDGYFDELGDQISSRLSEQNVANPVKTLIPRLAIAGSLAVVVIILFVIVTGENENDQPPVVSQQVTITLDEFEDHVSLSEFDDDMIVETLVLNETSGEDSREWEEAEDYLIENNVELSLIISEL